MAIHVGSATADVHNITGRQTYVGTVVDKTRAILKAIYHPGSITASAEYMEFLNCQTNPNVEQYTTKLASSVPDEDKLYFVFPSPTLKLQKLTISKDYSCITCCARKSCTLQRAGKGLSTSSTFNARWRTNTCTTVHVWR
jgi:hypothetical protein